MLIRRRGLDEEDVMELPREHARGAASTFDEGHLVLLGHGRRGDRERRRERPDQEVHLVDGDEPLDLADRRVGQALVVVLLQLDFPAEEAARVIDLLDPDLVPVLDARAGI